MKYKLIKEPDNSLSVIQQILYNRGISLNQIHHYLNTSDLDINSFDGLGIENLNYGTGKTSLDYYAISKETGKVYYAAGDEIGDRIYYTLTDELAGLIDVIHSTDNTYNN